MAFLWIFAFGMLLSSTSCEAGSDNCTPCKLMSVGEGYASEFRLKAFEKGVRLVYLNLKIGNDSYHPLELQDEFLPARWVWANTINEPMLSLSDDYDVLSLGLLNFQFRSMDVHLIDQPSGCLARMNSSCQNMAVGRMLLENVTREDSDKLLVSDKTQVVCVAMIKIVTADSGDLNRTEYHCCRMQKLRANGSFIRCELTVDDRSWVDTFDAIVFVLSFFMALYIPALPLAMPDCIFSLQYECDKEDRMEQLQEANSVQADSVDSHHTRNGYIQIENEEDEGKMIPVDDASPITVSTLLLECFKRLPDVRFSFNIKLAFMFCIYPCVLYIQLVLYSGYSQKQNIDESLRKHVSFSDQLLLLDDEVGQILFLGAVAFMGLILVLFLRPKDLILNQNVRCCLCLLFSHTLGLPSENWNRSVGDEVYRHLNILQRIIYNLIERSLERFALGFRPLTRCSQCTGLKMNRCTRPVCVLWSLVCILPVLIVVVAWGAICFICFLLLLTLSIFAFSPLLGLICLILLFIIKKVKLMLPGGPFEVLIFLFFFICLVILFLIFYFNYFVLYSSCSFISSVLGFTIVGLVLNADIVTPYVAFFLVVTTNIYLCYANLQNRFKEVKGMILKWKNELHINSSDPEDTISSKLFWSVCDRALPIKSEFCLMFRNVVFIVAFLFLVVYSIVFFGNQYNISAVFSTIAVFVSGVIPALVLKGLTKHNIFVGWEKINLKREIKTAVREFYQGNTENSIDMEGSQSHNINNDDTLV